MAKEKQASQDSKLPPGGPGSRQPSFLVSLVFVLLSVGVVLATGIYVWWQSYADLGASGTLLSLPTVGHRTSSSRSDAVARFASADEFRDWMIQSSENANSSYYGGLFGGAAVKTLAAPMAAMSEGALAVDSMGPTAGLGMGGGAPAPDRVSETNVQVAGIDEPDIVKTDGQEIYFSPTQYYYPVMTGAIEPMVDFAPDVMVRPSSGGGISSSSAIMPEYRPPGIKEIRAFPPADLKLDGQIDRSGEMLLYQDTLIVLAQDGLYAYDVSDPTSPQSAWQWKLEDGIYLTASRLKDGRIYLVTQTGINYNRPCPVPLFKAEDSAVSLGCGDVWHPVYPYPSDTTYSVSVIDAVSGQSQGTTGFVGSSSDTTVYMSADNLYVATGRDGDALDFMVAFFQANSDLAPSWVSAKLAKVVRYDLSQAAKEVELQQIMASWFGSLSSDERIKLENDLSNRLDDFYSVHLREWESTSIVRVSLKDLAVEANGNVPGRVLNQFSMDESDGNLRVAVTVGGRSAMSWRFGIGGGEHSVSDVYVLNSGLRTLGAAEDLGQGERIYSARFIGPRGYLVTFKETDPFYVLDLSDPKAPQVKGELKIPGYSSYLHPISDDRILGVGMEGSQVKLSLFDVADPTRPTELSKYTLKEYWSDAVNNHHAFLMDTKHQVFFLPGGQGGYVFSYKGDDLALARAIGNLQAKRAIYIDDYLYVIGEDRLVVLDENDWKEVNALDLTPSR